MQCKKIIFLAIYLLVTMAVSAQQPVITWSSSMSISSFSPKTGDLITFSTIISVRGGTAHNITIIGGVDSQDLLLKTIPMIKPSETKKIEFSWTATAGTHMAYFYIDLDRSGGNYRLETRKQERTVYVFGGAQSNTVKATGRTKPDITKQKLITPLDPVRVDPKKPLETQQDPHKLNPLMQETLVPPEDTPDCEMPALPDLVITKVEVSDGTYWIPGATCTIDITVDNIGQCDSGPVLVTLKVREIADNIDITRELGSTIIPTVQSQYGNPYKEASVSFNYTITAYSGIMAYYTFTATVDPDDKCLEFVEDNNVTSNTEQLYSN